MFYFVADLRAISRAQSNDTRTQKSLVIAHYRVAVSTPSALRVRSKIYFYSAQTITSIAHRHTRIWQWVIKRPLSIKL